jgi:DNA methylase
VSDQKIIANLGSVDWNFIGATTMRNTVHTLHWFPGNFIPEIPSYLIQILSNEGDVVFDPFCGSGTTGIEALRLGRLSWQSDVNRSSLQVACGKLATLTCEGLRGELKEFLASQALGSLFRPLSAEATEAPCLRALKWFHADTFADLRHLSYVIDSLPLSELKRSLRMLFSDTLFACLSTAGSATSGGTRRRHHWGWIADNVIPAKPVRHDATALFRNRVLRAIEVIKSNASLTTRGSLLLRQDARCLAIPDESVDLVVTSPPYLGMIDYTLASRIDYLWSGWPIEADKANEIGPRFSRNRSNAVKQYLEAMEAAAHQITRVLRPGKHCAIVIGTSRKYPDVSDKVISQFSKSLHVVWGPFRRIPTRMRVAERKGTAPKELLCVFSK